MMMAQLQLQKTQRRIHRVQIEFVRIEIWIFTNADQPLTCVHMLRVAWIPDLFHHPVKPPYAAAVFYRTGSFTIYTYQILLVLCTRDYFLSDNLVFPPVTKVVLVGELEKLARDTLLKIVVPFVEGIDIVVVFVFVVVRISVGKLLKAANRELVQMTVLPSHDTLKDMVKLLQCRSVQDLHSAPNRRARVLETYLQLINRLRSW
jgi:hypothetical protein